MKGSTEHPRGKASSPSPRAAGGRPYLVPQTAVVHGGQAVVDGGRSVLAERLPRRQRVQVAVLQRLHHSLADFLLNLNK